MTKQPWIKFYPADWRSDVALLSVSLAARGLWIGMISIMHEADPRGVLLVKGKPVTPKKLAALMASDEGEVIQLLDELEEMGVFQRKKNGLIFSKRMESDEKKARISRENGKKGGNPSLCSETVNSDWVNPQDKPVDKAKIPEARYQIKDKGTSDDVPKQKKSGSRLSPNWVPSEDELQFALTEGHGEASARREADKFRDFWIAKTGQGATKMDWNATWKNWIRNSKERRTGSHTGRPEPPKLTAFQQRQADNIAFLDGIIGKPYEQRDDIGGSSIDLGQEDFSSRTEAPRRIK